MRPKITWTVPRWADQAAWVPPLPAIRQRYGDDFGGLAGATEVVERAAARIEARGTKRLPPVHAYDVKATLQRIAEQPESMPASGLDGGTKAALQDAARRLFGDFRLAGMAPEKLQACALEALRLLPSRSGQPQQDVIAQMVSELWGLGLDQLPKARRAELLTEAIKACGNKVVSLKSIERYETLARRGRILRET